MSQIKNMLVPGGLGFIGSHTVVHILEQTKANVIIVDDFSNCFDDVLLRIRMILSSKFTNQTIDSRLKFHKGNILDLNFLQSIFETQALNNQPIDAIMHFAAKKAIGESYVQPIMYYENNVIGSMNLFKLMEKYKTCKNFIFSSTAGVYGDKDNCKQTDLISPTSPYGQSKACVEMLLSSLAKVHQDWRIISLRYFNPCGAHQSYLLGDQPYVYPNNLFPFIQEVIIGKRQKLNIFGKDYPTPDGTCVRDYIHITDLANGHVMAMKKLTDLTGNYDVFNLGTGCGYSVLQVVNEFQKCLGKSFNYSFGEKRKGDIPKLRADIQKATKYLGWKVTKSLNNMCQDSLTFIQRRDKQNKQKLLEKAEITHT